MVDRLCDEIIFDDTASNHLPSGNYNWWLRSIGRTQSSASIITDKGEILSQSARWDYIGVRPAMWIDLNAIKDEFIEPQKKYIDYGMYYQNDLNNKEKISWRVLTEKDNKMLIISQFGLDLMNFNDDVLTLWEDSKIKKWLNNEFKYSAFTKDEINKINGDIALLSIEEALEYFDDRNDRKCYITDYAVKQGGYKFKEGTCFYWLRSEGVGGCKTLVNADGGIHLSGMAQRLYNVVRPVMWIEIE
jgi:hypothetical protein